RLTPRKLRPIRKQHWHSILESANRGWRGSTTAPHLPSPFFNSQTRQRSLPMKFRPLHDRLVVRRVEEDTKTKGGIIIPDTAQEKPMQGEVIAAGPGARDESGRIVPLDVKRGDRVLFG